jgi:RNA polymerase sigma factor (sigma-70 family)
MLDLTNLEEQVRLAQEGDLSALEAVIEGVQHQIYNLSVRMLGHPHDAQDATQEILVKIVTGLGGFRGESAFTTWVYRVATNHLFNLLKSRRESRETSFEAIGDRIEAGLAAGLGTPPAGADIKVLVEEVRITCTQGMLMSLDHDHRAAFILGEVFELSGAEAAEILEITGVAYRQRLARARTKLRDFMFRHCGLVNADRPCRCEKQVPAALATGKLAPGRLEFAGHPRLDDRKAFVQETHELRDLARTAALMRAHPSYAAPETFKQGILTLLSKSSFGAG